MGHISEVPAGFSTWPIVHHTSQKTAQFPNPKSSEQLRQELKTAWGLGGPAYPTSLVNSRGPLPQLVTALSWSSHLPECFAHTPDPGVMWGDGQTGRGKGTESERGPEQEVVEAIFCTRLVSLAPLSPAVEDQRWPGSGEAINLN